MSAFKPLLDGPLANFVKSSDAIGRDVKTQAAAFEDGWNAEANFLAKAFITPKPHDVVKSMLSSIGEKMGVVGNMAEQACQRDPLTQHLTRMGRKRRELPGTFGTLLVPVSSIRIW